MILCTFRALLSCLGQLNYVQAMWFAQNVQQLFSLCCNCWDIYALLTPVFLPKNACLFTKMSPSEELVTLSLRKKSQYNFPKKGRGGGGQRSFGNFPEIHPFWYIQASLGRLCYFLPVAIFLPKKQPYSNPHCTRWEITCASSIWHLADRCLEKA